MYLGWSLCTLSLLACQVSYHRRLGSLCLCAIFQASINCLLILHWLSGPRHVSDCIINTYVQNRHACSTIAIFTTLKLTCIDGVCFSCQCSFSRAVSTGQTRCAVSQGWTEAGASPQRRQDPDDGWQPALDATLC